MKDITHVIHFYVDDDQDVPPTLVFELLTGLKRLDSLNCGILGLSVKESPFPTNTSDKEEIPF